MFSMAHKLKLKFKNIYYIIIRKLYQISLLLHKHIEDKINILQTNDTFPIKSLNNKEKNNY